MKDKCYLDNLFISDVGFNHIRTWLANQSKCKENYNYFSLLEPTYNHQLLQNEFQYTDELVKSLHRKENLVQKKIDDIKKILLSLEVKDEFLEINEIVELRNMIYHFIDMKKRFNKNHFKLWNSKTYLIDNPKLILSKIKNVINDEDKIKNNASKDLQKIVKTIEAIHKKIEHQIKKELEKYNKLGYLRENKIIYREEKVMLPVSASFKNKVKGIVDGFSATKQTCFIEPISLVQLNNQLNETLVEKKKEIIKILKKLTSEISLEKLLLENIYKLVKYYDLHYTIALLSLKLDGEIPEFSDKVLLKGAINPLFTLNDKKYIPLDFLSKDRHKTIVISGPNSGGKTIVIKSIGLYCLMAQCGLYVPARVAMLPIFKSFLSDIGDKQSLDDDLSTFSAHMKQISMIINKSNDDSLIIIDEMGTGTDPDIGSSLSISILNKLTKNKSFNLCTTHLTPLKVWANENSNAENASMEFDEKNIKPTFILKQGIPGSSYGIEIAQRMGINKKIIEAASTNLDRKSFEMENLITEINVKQKKLDEKLKDIESLKAELNELNELNENVKSELNEKNKKFEKERANKIKEEILLYRKSMESLIENIKKNNANKDSIKEAKVFIDKTLSNISTEKSNYIPSEEKIDFSIGDTVQINNSNESGIIIKINKKLKNATLEINNKKLSISMDELYPVKRNNKKPSKNHTTRYNIEPLDSPRIDLRGMRVDEAISELDIFLDRAILSNLESVDILHGKGTGALQKAVHEYLNDTKFVKHFNFAPVDQGGSGITIVEFSKK